MSTSEEGGGFAGLLRAHRESAGLTQEELAERSGLTTRAISNMERGRTARPYLRSVRLLAEALELPGLAREQLTAAARPRNGRRSVPGGRRKTAAAPAQRSVVLPRQLPPAIGHFVGRADELKALDGLLDQRGGPGGVVVISAIAGTAGVGKTALAVQWAHQVADRFLDGQLYVNLRGHDPGQPMSAADALAGFLCALGVPSQDIPAEVDERAARYRSMLAGRQMLVVLDNAGEVEQVRPLLPAAPACAVVMTSRDALVGLVARDGAQRLDLDLLPLADAVGLLRALIGGRVDEDPEAAAVLAGRCARLPLAVRVAAELAAARPAISLARLAAELADQQQRLDLLDAGGDPRTAVRAVFSWSYRHLPPDAARAFRLLGLHPGADFDHYAAAALTGTTVERAQQLVDQLARAHLIHNSTHPDRYGMHDLLRAYACGQAIAQDRMTDRRAALTRLFDYYLHTAAVAMDTLVPAERHRRPRVPRPASPAPLVAGPAAALAWLDAERANLAAVAGYAAGHGWPGHATRLAATLFRYLDAGGHYAESVTIHTRARHAAGQSGDRAAEATALAHLAVVDLRQGRYRQATGHLEQALPLARQAGDRTGEARAITNLGLVDYQQGRYQPAADHYRQALRLWREIGDRAGEAYALENLGCADQRRGRYEQAADHLEQALALFREIGDRTGEAHVLRNLGDLHRRQAHYPQAADYQRQALALFRETGDRVGEAHALTGLGVANLGLGHYPQATGYHRQALALFREIGELSGEAVALNGLGELLLAIGKPDQARRQHATAIRLAGQIGNRHEQARAHNGLALAYHAAGDPRQSRRHWRQSLTLYADLGAPEADQLRAQLAAADDQDRPELKPPA